MSAAKEIRIIGGGLAGLSLGIGLLRHEIPVTVVEASSYPRHKVCGEFIAGLPDDTIATLGLESELSDAARHRSVTWLREGRPFRRDRLPRPALGISRYRLDQRLANRFAAAGGTLRIHERWRGSPAAPGHVWAAGRQRGGNDWIGLKAHVRGLSLDGDLELHLGDDAYVGASTVENGWINVCGLFRRRALARTHRASALINYLHGSGCRRLAERLAEAEINPDSIASVAALRFGKLPTPAIDAVLLGDAYALIPPFTGDGMSMAFESAALAIEPLRRYATGAATWRDACETIRARLDHCFRRRLFAARILHPILRSAAGQTLFRRLGPFGVIPFESIFQLLHRR